MSGGLGGPHPDDDPVRVGPSPLSIRRYELDIDRGVAIVELADGGGHHVLPLPVPLTRAQAGMRRAVYDSVKHQFAVTLPMGDVIVLDMVAPGSPWPAPEHPVVYLDQLHWITLAQCRWTPEKLSSEPERIAGERIIELARRRAICLPFSAGNLTEMTQMGGRRRRHLATTILGLSCGWQMRNPVTIRRRELEAIFSGGDPRVADPFTLQVGEVFIDGLPPAEAPADFPSDWRHWFQSMTAVNAMVASMIDEEKIPKTDGDEMAAGWASSHHDLAVYMREHRFSKEQVRRGALDKLAYDLAPEITAAAEASDLGKAELTAWIEDSFKDDLARMPYLGRQHEVIHLRLSNADDRWERKDLTDVNYLSCAAAYADVVVGEKKTCEYLKRSRNRVLDGAFVCRKLADAVARLDELLATA
jgi:hypothetical protein